MPVVFSLKDLGGPTNLPNGRVKEGLLSGLTTVFNSRIRSFPSGRLVGLKDKEHYERSKTQIFHTAGDENHHAWLKSERMKAFWTKKHVGERNSIIGDSRSMRIDTKRATKMLFFASI